MQPGHTSTATCLKKPQMRTGKKKQAKQRQNHTVQSVRQKNTATNAHTPKKKTKGHTPCPNTMGKRLHVSTTGKDSVPIEKHKNHKSHTRLPTTEHKDPTCETMLGAGTCRPNGPSGHTEHPYMSQNTGKCQQPVGTRARATHVTS